MARDTGAGRCWCFWLTAFFLVIISSQCTPANVVPTRSRPVSLPTTTPPAISAPSPIPATAVATPPLSPAPTLCTGPGRIETGRFSSATAGMMAYRIYLPPCYGEDGRSYPTLYLLPGNIHTDAIWDELGIDEKATAAINAQTIPPLLIVMADGGDIANNTSGGPGSYETVILNDLIPTIQQTYCAWSDPAGRAIGGLSRGGYWALEIAFRHPEQFASVGGHSAALLDQYAGPDVNPQYTGLSNDLGDLRIYLDIGTADYVRTNTIRLHEDLDAAGVPHTWMLNNGRHEDAYWAAHLAEYLAWYTTPWPISREEYPSCSP